MHLCAPEADELDCDDCKTYWHYGWTADKDKRGKPIIRGGKMQPWPKGKQPNCGACPGTGKWTDENRELYYRVKRKRIFGGRPSESEIRAALILEDEQDKIDGKRLEWLMSQKR